MNLETAAAISSIADYSKTDDVLDQAIHPLKWYILLGGYAVCTTWDPEARLSATDCKREEYQPFMIALFSGDKVAAIRGKELLSSLLNNPSMEEVMEECLHIPCQLADQLHLHETEFSALFPERVDYFEKLSRLGWVKGLELRMNDYLRRVSDYLKDYRGDRQEDIIQRACRLMADNYASLDMTLKSVADCVGLNEKHLDTKFAKETGIAFSAYLISIRLERTKWPMDITDLKMYETNGRVGYRNVERFDRMFKKAYSINPSGYKHNPC